MTTNPPLRLLSYSSMRSADANCASNARSPVARRQWRRRACATMSRSNGSLLNPISLAFSNHAAEPGSSITHRSSCISSVTDAPARSRTRPASIRNCSRESSPATRRGGLSVARARMPGGRHDAIRSPRWYRGQSTASLGRERQTVGLPRPGPLAGSDSWIEDADERLARAPGGFGSLGADEVTHATPFDDDLFTAPGRVEHVGQPLAYLRSRIPLHLHRTTGLSHTVAR